MDIARVDILDADKLERKHDVQSYEVYEAMGGKPRIRLNADSIPMKMCTWLMGEPRVEDISWSFSSTSYHGLRLSSAHEK